MIDFQGLLQTLVGGGVRFLIVVGAAATAHGSARLTQDLDVVYDRSPENMERPARCLAPHEPYLRGAPPGLPFVLDTETLQRGSSELGEGEQIEREIARFEHTGAAPPSHLQRYYAAAFRAGRLLVAGNFHDARERIERVEQLAGPRDPSQSLFTPTTHRTLLPLTAAEARQLEASVEAIVHAFPRVRSWRVAFGLVYQLQGRYAEARRQLDADLRHGVAAFLLGNVTDPAVLAVLTIVSYRLGYARYAEDLPDAAGRLRRTQRGPRLWGCLLRTRRPLPGTRGEPVGSSRRGAGVVRSRKRAQPPHRCPCVGGAEPARLGTGAR